MLTFLQHHCKRHAWNVPPGVQLGASIVGAATIHLKSNLRLSHHPNFRLNIPIKSGGVWGKRWVCMVAFTYRSPYILANACGLTVNVTMTQLISEHCLVVTICNIAAPSTHPLGPHRTLKLHVWHVSMSWSTGVSTNFYSSTGPTTDYDGEWTVHLHRTLALNSTINFSPRPRVPFPVFVSTPDDIVINLWT